MLRLTLRQRTAVPNSDSNVKVDWTKLLAYNKNYRLERDSGTSDDSGEYSDFGKYS